jgi:uncharacterized membrane protein YbaN (DUF454 family)
MRFSAKQGRNARRVRTTWRIGAVIDPRHDYGDEVHPLASRAARWMLIVAGTILVGLGVLGVVLPVLPGTPFLLLAAACYARASNRFYNALLNNRVVGPTIVNWRHSRTMPLQAKVSAIGLVTVAFGVTVGWVLVHLWARLGMIALAVGIIVFIARVPTSQPPRDR